MPQFVDRTHSFNTTCDIQILDDHSVAYDNKNDRKTNSTEIYRAMAMLEEITNRKTVDSWTNAQEKMLSKWAEHAMTYKSLHARASEYYRRTNDLLAYPIILVSSVLGMGGFVMISEEKPTHIEIILAYVMAGCNIIVAFLSSVQKVKRFSELSEQHQTASVEYLKFHREIKMELILDRGSRTYSTDFCRDAKYQYDRLATNYPTIPRHIVNAYNNIHVRTRDDNDIQSSDTVVSESDV